MKHILIVGGGIAGLAAAYYARKKSHLAGEDLNITVLESARYWGGKILTEREAGFVIEGGPDTFLATKPWAVALCEELGMAEGLQGTNPRQRNTYVLRNGRLQPLPEGLTMMNPTRFSPMIRTGLLSWPAKVRMGMDFLLPPKELEGEESLGEFVTRRLGRDAYENLIEPLLSGIYAGDGDQLSTQATFPILRELETRHGGLIKGALAMRTRMAKNGSGAKKWRSIFLTPSGGLAEIVEVLTGWLGQHEVDLRLNNPVDEISMNLSQAGFHVDVRDGGTFHVDALILATPSFVSADLLAGIDAQLAEELRRIEYVSTATVSLAYHLGDMPRPLDGYGYVIPRREGRKALACTWTSTKFPHRAPVDYALLRVFIGRAGQEGQISWEPDSLEAIAREELSLTLGVKAEPVLSRVFLWERAMPQYNVGHVSRLARIQDRLACIPALALAGNAYSGIGIPDCIHSGELAAERVLQVLS
jgi:protoporphyrinogen/coproporphyrinogen III oxidase